MTPELPYTISLIDHRDRAIKVKASFSSLHDAKAAYKYFKEHMSRHQALRLWDDEEDRLITCTEID